MSHFYADDAQIYIPVKPSMSRWTSLQNQGVEELKLCLTILARQLTSTLTTRVVFKTHI